MFVRLSVCLCMCCVFMCLWLEIIQKSRKKYPTKKNVYKILGDDLRYRKAKPCFLKFTNSITKSLKIVYNWYNASQ